MFVGHLGAGLAIQATTPRANLGALVAGALFADLLLWTLVMLGVETVGAPVVSDGARFLTFTFPYSHGLVASVVAALGAGGAAWVVLGARETQRARIAAALGLAVASHFVLDWVVHVPDLPVAGAASPKLGLGLWRTMPAALAVEMALVAAAGIAWFPVLRPPRGRAWLLAIVLVVAAAFTAAGPYAGGDLPPPRVLAATTLASLAIVVGVGFIVDRRVGLLTGRPARNAAPTPGLTARRL